MSDTVHETVTKISELFQELFQKFDVSHCSNHCCLKAMGNLHLNIENGNDDK